MPEEKLTGYLLSATHPLGRWKCGFFHALGYHVERWKVLAADLTRMARAGSVQEVLHTEYGAKYVIDGTLSGPNGRTASVRTIWVIDAGREEPRFVTAYPLGRQE